MNTYADFESRPLLVVKEPGTEEPPPLRRTDETTLFWQILEDKVRHDCGNCGQPLALGWMPPWLSGVVLQCSACEAYNRIP